jgi:hypothetical protein
LNIKSKTIKINQKIILLYNGLTGVPKRLHCEEAIVKLFTQEKIKIYVPITSESMNIRYNQFRFKFDIEFFMNLKDTEYFIIKEKYKGEINYDRYDRNDNN